MGKYFKSIDKIFILGRSGCGKSHLGKIAQDQFPRKIVIDSTHEYKSGEFDYVVNTFKSLVVAMASVETKKTFKILFRFDLRLDDETRVYEFDRICEAVYQLGDVCFVVEEVHLYCSPQKLPIWLKNLALMGRHRNISLICTSQRAGITNKNLLSMGTYIYCGQMIDFNDQSYVGNFIGKNSKELSTIPDRSFIEYSSDNPTETRIVKNDFLTTGLDIRQKSTVNLKARPKQTKEKRK